MAKTVLVTGGAGFIGSHIADDLLAHGYRVRVLDSLVPQVHGARRKRPAVVSQDVELFPGDVRDPGAVRAALDGVSMVIHLAALVGVGQSMYRIASYESVNAAGTATLLEAIIEHPVERLVVASSMSIYGEGRYVDPTGAIHDHVERDHRALEQGLWEPTTVEGHRLTPIPTAEDKPPRLASVYALSKFDQERLCLIIGRAYGIPTVALRLFNVYGPRQALSNPYTGVLAIFATRLLNRKPPLIFEDGGQLRDFVCVRDVARAFRLALEATNVAHEAINIGSGLPHTVTDIAARMAAALDREDAGCEITREYRVGDVRHCFADINRAREALGYAPEVSLDDGIAELCDWLGGQQADDRVAEARHELSSRGLTL